MKLYSVKDFSVITGIPLPTVKRYCKQGKLKTEWQNCNGGKRYLINVGESYKDEPQKLRAFFIKELNLKLELNNLPEYLDKKEEYNRKKINECLLFVSKYRDLMNKLFDEAVEEWDLLNSRTKTPLNTVNSDFKEV